MSQIKNVDLSDQLKYMDELPDESDKFGDSLSEQTAYVDKLPHDIQYSLRFYSYKGYVPINGFLRGLRSEISPSVKKHVENIITAFRDVPPLREPIIVYRGKLSDKIYSDKAFLSTSLIMETTQDFSRECCVFKITVSAGSKVLPIENFSIKASEQEILLDRNGKLEKTNTEVREIDVPCPWRKQKTTIISVIYTPKSDNTSSVENIDPSLPITPLNFPKLTTEQIDMYKSDETVRRNVITSVNDILHLYGYTLGTNDVFKQKLSTPNILYDETNYRKIKRMLTFLNKIDMEYLSGLVMLSLCYAMKADSGLRKQFKESGYWNRWLKTQSYVDIHECPFTGLEYTGNSCYQDSTLLALFAIPNKFIDDHILEKDVKTVSTNPGRSLICSENVEKDFTYRSDIQKELISITHVMRSGKNSGKQCSNLRTLIKNCRGSQAFHGTGTQDAGEFLQYLFSLFDVEDVYQERTVRVSNDLEDIPESVVEVRKDRNRVSPIILISSHTIRQTLTSRIDLHLEQVQDSILDEKNPYKGWDGTEYRRRIEILKISSASYLIFYANRIFRTDKGEIERTFNELVPTETIKLNENELNLFAVVVHRTEHYTCYIKCQNNWFYYNDMRKNIQYIGTYEKMLDEKVKPNVKTEGVLYFYSV